MLIGPCLYVGTGAALYVCTCVAALILILYRQTTLANGHVCRHLAPKEVAVEVCVSCVREGGRERKRERESAYHQHKQSMLTVGRSAYVHRST